MWAVGLGEQRLERAKKVLKWKEEEKKKTKKSKTKKRIITGESI